MNAGNFNIKDYLNKLYEAAEEGGPTDTDINSMIPDENKKTCNSFGLVMQEINDNKKFTFIDTKEMLEGIKKQI